MDEAAMRRRVAEARVARLGTVDARDRPHVVPVCFALDGDLVWSAVDDKPKTTRRLQRLRNVARNPRVTLLVDHYEEDWTRVWWVRVRGTATVIEDGPERERAVALLREKYPQYETHGLGAVVRLSIDEWKGWSAS